MTLIGSINELNVWANESRLLLWGLEDDLDFRGISAYNLGQHGGIGWVAIANRAVLDDLIEAMQYFVYGHTSSFSYTMWSTVHTGLYNKEAEITWRSIVEAWSMNDFEGAGVTIAFIDRMRQLIWDKPFYALWAAKPEQQDF